MKRIKQFGTYLNEELYPSSVGMAGYNSGVSGYPIANVMTSTGDVDPVLQDVLKNQQFPAINYPKRRVKKKPNEEVAKRLDNLSLPVVKATNEGSRDKSYELVFEIEVEDRQQCLRIIDKLKHIPHNTFWRNEYILTLDHFPNWLNIDLNYEDRSISINYWSDEGEYDHNLERVRDWVIRTGVNKIHGYDDFAKIERMVREYFDVPLVPDYTPRRTVRSLDEGVETTSTVGSGTMVGFGDQPQKYVKSAGQAVYGGDSPSAFAGNSTGNEVELGVVCPPKERFKEHKKRKRKHKQGSEYSNKGATMDTLYRNKKTIKENMIQSWEEFKENKQWNERYLREGLLDDPNFDFEKSQKDYTDALLHWKHNRDEEQYKIPQYITPDDSKIAVIYEDKYMVLGVCVESPMKAQIGLPNNFLRRELRKIDNKLNEDEGSGGVATATLGSTGGMGAVVSAQPSSIPGDVAGSTIGSGDIGRVLGTYTQQPAGIQPKRKKEKRKKEKLYHKIGSGIDRFYTTKYVQSNSDGNIIQRWNTFKG